MHNKKSATKNITVDGQNHYLIKNDTKGKNIEMENDALVLGGRARGDSRNKALSKKQIRIISVEKYNIT